MKKKLILLIPYIIIFFNSNLLGNEDKNILKIGLLAPLSGEYKELGDSLLHSLELALNEINDNKVFIIPRDSGFNDSKKLNAAVQDLKSNDVKIIIGPISHKDFKEVNKYNDIVFISPSNTVPEFFNNIISIGISLESQLLAILNFIKKQKKTKTVILFPQNHYAELIESKLKKMNLENVRTFKSNPNPQTEK